MVTDRPKESIWRTSGRDGYQHNVRRAMGHLRKDSGRAGTHEVLGRTAKVGGDSHQHEACWQVVRFSIEDEAPVPQNLLNRRLHRRQVPIDLWQDEDVG